jgi:hypothetical protein
LGVASDTDIEKKERTSMAWTKIQTGMLKDGTSWEVRPFIWKGKRWFRTTWTSDAGIASAEYRTIEEALSEMLSS